MPHDGPPPAAPTAADDLLRARLRPRQLLADVPAALAVGFGTWASLLLARLPPGPRADGPPWVRGPGWSPRPPVWETSDPPWALGVLVVLLAAAVAVRRVWLLPSFLAVVTTTAMLLGSGTPFGPLCLGAALGLGALAAAVPARTWAPWAGLLVPVLAFGWWPFDAAELTADNLTSTAFTVVVLTVAALLGGLRRARRLGRERARAEELRRSADAERLRIAREVHDLVGHSLTVITMQAGVALHVVNRRPEQAEEALRAIRRTGLDAMAELRSTLQVFRDGADSTRPPPPGLARLDALLADLRGAGRTVRLVADDLGTLPPTVDHAAYRIVQESLTNVGKHAPTAAADVRLVRGSAELVVHVRDDGPARTTASIRPGHGIAGMQERARALGGSCSVTVLPEGGVLVAARLPVEGA